MDQEIIRTSEPGWFLKLARAYRERRAATLIDDGGIGVDPEAESLLEMGRKSRLSSSEWAAVLVALGVSSVGVWLVRMAILDPEPTSKLWLLIGSGAVCIIGGGFLAIQILSNRRPPTVRITPEGISIVWESE